MFVGHYAVALAAKRAAPQTSLGTTVLAAQLVDLVWPVMLLLGLERVRIDPGNTAFTPLDFESYPITHSLATALGWGLALGAVYWLARRYPRGALVVGILVVSHWLLDFITHRPDLPLAPGLNVKVGLGLWSSVPATLALELALWAAGIWVFVRTSAPRDGVGRWGFWTLIAVLTLIHVGNVLGPPPPDVRSLALVSLGLWLFVPWAYWVDAHRDTRTAPAHAGSTVAAEAGP